MALQILEKTPSVLGRGTLGRHLVIRVAAIVALTAILLSAAAMVAVVTFLSQKVDEELVTLVGRQHRVPGGAVGPAGIPVGGITMTVADDRTHCVQLSDENEWQPCASENVAVLLGVARSGEESHGTTVTLSDGRYRAMVADGPGADVKKVTALPIHDLDRIATGMLWSLVALTLAAVTASVVVTRLVVARTVRPLHDVAKVAAEVSRYELDRGEVQLAVRVPGSSTSTTTEVGRVGAALNYMLDNVEQALAARQASEMKVRQFVADASHELRNPLAAIRGYAELTRRGRDQLPEDTQFAMSRIESESERMSRLVDDLLLLARLDNGPAIDLADVDIAEVVVNAVADAQVAGSDHEWSVTVPEREVVVPGDPFRLHQVVANLLANARTHTPAGTSVHAEVAVDGIFAVVTVTDDGPGIAPEILPRVFERFVRADTSRARRQNGQSTGLGLSIVAAVVAAHKGRASVTSEPGRTTFTLRLPVSLSAPRSSSA